MPVLKPVASSASVPSLLAVAVACCPALHAAGYLAACQHEPLCWRVPVTLSCRQQADAQRASLQRPSLESPFQRVSMKQADPEDDDLSVSQVQGILEPWMFHVDNTCNKVNTMNEFIDDLEVSYADSDTASKLSAAILCLLSSNALAIKQDVFARLPLSHCHLSLCA